MSKWRWDEEVPYEEIMALSEKMWKDMRRAAYVNYWRRMREPGKIDYEAMYKDWMLFPDWK